MLTKEKVISEISAMPEPLQLDDILEKIVLINEIEIGIEQSIQNKTIDDDELDKRIEQWFV